MAAPAPLAAYAVDRGSPHPLGATPRPDGVNFSLFSENATGVELLLFAGHDSPQPFQTIQLNPATNHSFHFWHVFVRGLSAGAHYAFRVDGPFNPAAGHRFDRDKVLIDPYARGNTNSLWNRAAACRPGDNVAASMRSIVIDPSGYDWEGDRPLNRPMEDTVIYEMHVRGFTRSPSSGVRNPGTFDGIIEKIPYLRELGVTAVELLPVFDSDETTPQREVDGVPVTNYWGYSTISFFAPQNYFCVSPERGSHLREFRDLVKALHRAGIEVILDVVFNHTGEDDRRGPTFCFRGIDNRIYYFLVPSDLSDYLDFSGCGNTVNCNHPIAQKLIVECLRYWVREAHVDGFRFDEASILSRAEDGMPSAHPPVVWQIELDDELAETKIIAEAWDAAGLYQIGGFPGGRWAEWNGRFRDDIRRFVRAEPGIVGAVASRIAGSSDIYQVSGRLPVNSVNFVTCHDGFTLNDLVSYEQKHNLANGEDNRDGSDSNLSWNCGVEGPTEDPEIEALRERQVRNFAAILMLSRGVPMLMAGDEVRRTQRGNNNAYCQDNEVSWFDWELTARNGRMLRFWQRLIEFRRSHAVLRYGRFFTGAINERGLPDIAWHGVRLHDAGWNDRNARVLAFTLAGLDGGADLHVMMNMYWEPLQFELPSIPGRTWRIAFDTFDDTVDGDPHIVRARSIVVLVNG
jgi:isoamylase